MKRTLLAGAIFMASMQSWADSVEFFKGSLEQALEKAGDEQKLLFVDVYTDWCGPCKVMDKQVFTDDDVAAYYNANFINFKLNAEDDEGNRVAFADQYEITGYPTLLYLRPNGEEHLRVVGGLSVSSFIGQGKVAVDGEVDFDSLMAQYEAGATDQSFMEEFLIAGIAKLDGYSRAGEVDKANEFGEEMVVISERYLNALPKEKSPTKANITVLSRLVKIRGLENPINQYVYDNAKLFYGLDDSTLARYLSDFHLSKMLGAAAKGDLGYQSLLEQIKSEKHFKEGFASWGKGVSVEDAGYRVMKAYCDIAYAENKKDWQGFMSGMDDMYDLRGDTFLGSPDFPSMAKQMISGGCSDAGLNQRLMSYAKTSYDRKPLYSYQSGMIYAELLANLGEVDKAKSVISDMKQAFSDKFAEQAETYIKRMDALLDKIS